MSSILCGSLPKNSLVMMMATTTTTAQGQFKTNVLLAAVTRNFHATGRRCVRRYVSSRATVTTKSATVPVKMNASNRVTVLNNRNAVTHHTNSRISQQQCRRLHSSSKQEKPTPGLSMEANSSGASKQSSQQAGTSASTSQTVTTAKPTRDQLKILFTASAVPMIGFGFMDNIVMIQAGQFIDNTIGVTMGLATMTAAAAGQVVSDVSGVIFGGSLERFLHRYRLIAASSLTTAQRALPICRNVAMLGAVCGVALGCGLGASCLLFMDLEARERAERAIQLKAVLNDMMDEAATVGRNDDNGQGDNGTVRRQFCETCTIHLAHDPTAEQFSAEHQKLQDGNTRIAFLPSLEEQEKKKQGTMARRSTVKSASSASAFRAAQKGHSMRTSDRSVLFTPILSKAKETEGQVVAVLEFCNKPSAPEKKLQDNSSDDSVGATGGFTAEDEKSAKIMAKHIAIFMHRLARE